MSDIKITPFQQENLAEIGAFLHANLNKRISAQDWINSLTHPWSATRPNYGVQMRDKDRLVGVFCAIYSDQVIDGKVESFCNPHSWCVLEEYRSHGIGLVLALIKQRGFHFTMLTPNPKVAEIFRHFKFVDLDKRIVIFPNLGLPRLGSHSIVESDTARIAQHLPTLALRDFELHKDIPWLNFLAFGPSGNACLMAYKVETWKKLPCARVIYISDAKLCAAYGASMRNYLLFKRGIPVSKVEQRFLANEPKLAYRMMRTQGKLFLSKTLRDSQIKDFYTELASLDV